MDLNIRDNALIGMGEGSTLFFLCRISWIRSCHGNGFCAIFAVDTTHLPKSNEWSCDLKDAKFAIFNEAGGLLEIHDATGFKHYSGGGCVMLEKFTDPSTTVVWNTKKQVSRTKVLGSVIPPSDIIISL